MSDMKHHKVNILNCYYLSNIRSNKIKNTCLDFNKNKDFNWLYHMKSNLNSNSNYRFSKMNHMDSIESNSNNNLIHRGSNMFLGKNYNRKIGLQHYSLYNYFSIPNYILYMFDRTSSKMLYSDSIPMDNY